MVCWLTFSFSQVGSFYAETQLNRVGVGHELGYAFKQQKFTMNIGAKLYFPNLVFTKVVPGLSVGINYGLKSLDKFTLVIGAESSFFRVKEQTPTHHLTLIDPFMYLGTNWTVTPRVHLHTRAGTGGVFNYLKAHNTAYNNKSYSYLNYEISLGISYWFGGSTTR